MKSFNKLVILSAIYCVITLIAPPSYGKYESGQDLANQLPNLLKKEGGKWITVPAEYKNPRAGKLKIYYWTGPNFDLAKPTVVYVIGGPGYASHKNAALLMKASAIGNFNFVFFDQRGLGFSRPDTEKVYKNAEIYYSEYIAQDMKKILDNLGVKKWTVYAGSYGTIPATIFGHLFPESTEALVLEGTLYTNWLDNSLSEYWVSILNGQITNNLNKNGLKILSFYMNGSAFSDRLVENCLYGISNFKYLVDYLNSLPPIKSEPKFSNEIFDNLKYALSGVDVSRLSIEKKTSSSVQESVNKESQNKDPEADKRAELDLRDDWISKNIREHEQGVGTENILSFSLRRKGFYIYQQGTPIEMNPWVADNYTLKVPVTYFQGIGDPVTNLPGAVKHFKNVAGGKRQMVIFPKGGHSSNFSSLALGEEYWIKKVFVKAISGEAITSSDLLPLKDKFGNALAVVAHPKEIRTCSEIF